MKELTVYEVMGEDMYVIARLKGESHVSIEIIDENEETAFMETTNIAAWDSIVSFAKQVIRQDDKIQCELNGLNIKD
jgi:hypothetical protein